jgi:hypothetical protein
VRAHRRELGAERPRRGNVERRGEPSVGGSLLSRNGSRRASCSSCRKHASNLFDMPGQGIRVSGSHTLGSSSRFTDIATVRLIAALGVFIDEATSWAAFERRNVAAWNRLQTSGPRLT